MKRKVWKNLWQTAAAIAFGIVVWTVAYVCVGNDLIVPSFSDTFSEVFRLLGEGVFWRSFFHTLWRVLLAFVLSFVSAGGFAVLAYLVPSFRRFFAPIVSVLRSLPVLAVLLILLIWAGAGVAPVLVAFLSLFPMLYTGLYAALAGVDGDLIEMSRVFRVPLKRRILSLYLPSVAPYALREAGSALAFALKLVVSAEVLARTATSLGNLMQDAQIYAEMPALFALVFVACGVGFVLECLGEFAAKSVERSWK